MRTDKIKRIVKKISRIYGVEDYFKITRISRGRVEIRTELTSYDGGARMSRELEALEPGWICENLGGCVYMLYNNDKEVIK